MATPSAEVIFNIGAFKVTGAVVATLLADGVIIAVVVGVRRRLSEVPGKLQGAVEAVVEFFSSIARQVASERSSWIVPWVLSFFLYIVVSNLLSILPGYHTIGLVRDTAEGHVFIPFLTANTANINATLALALVCMVVTHFLAIRSTGLGEYLKRFFSLNPLLLFVGLLEIVSEITKVISLSLRLYGNMHAGHAVLDVISSKLAFLLPLPFIALEILVGVVQATVFAMLTMAFMAVLSQPHQDGGNHK